MVTDSYFVAFAVPNPPEDPEIIRTAAFELEVSWSAPALGYYDYYVLRYSLIGETDYIESQVASGDVASDTLTGLEPETSYDISILSVRGTGFSEPAQVYGTTGKHLITHPTDLNVCKTIWISYWPTLTIKNN